jgi:hypothetical protein
VSLYHAQKILYNLNREPEIQRRFREDRLPWVDHIQAMRDGEALRAREGRVDEKVAGV